MERRRSSRRESFTNQEKMIALDDLHRQYLDAARAFRIEFMKIMPLNKRFESKNLALLNDIIEENHFLARSKPIEYNNSDDIENGMISNPKTIYLIGVYKGWILGHCNILPRNEDLLEHIGTIGYAVRKEFRRKGIAELLLKKSLKIAEMAKEYEGVRAEVAADNVNSIKLLQKFGFEEAGRLTHGFRLGKGRYVDLIYFLKIF